MTESRAGGAGRGEVIDSDQGGRGEEGDKGYDSEYILKVVDSGFADR